MMKAANNGAAAFGEVERPDDKEGGGGGGGGRRRKNNNADDDEGNVSYRGEEDEYEEFARKNRLGLNKRGGDDDEECPRGGDLDFDDDDIEKGDEWEHEEIFTDDDEAVGNDPEEREDLLAPEIHAPPEIKQAQKLISLCGWEPRWLPNIQDYEEHSAQSAKNGVSLNPSKHHNPNKKTISKDSSKKETRSPLLDCSLCGAIVRILDFIHVNRPSRFSPNNIDVPEASKNIVITYGISAATGVNGWVEAEQQTEDIDEAATT
uniref:Transcription initiation factor IIF subunit alpha n=1 Tax=Lactuca sativa TaxID=4236 RepID=A0A9R1VB92_LACSA|nr:hypothetical protein LSAT_V11C500234880 [Lactuca sativa]